MRPISVTVPLGIIVAFPVIMGVTSFLVHKRKKKKLFKARKREFELSNDIDFEDYFKHLDKDTP